MTGVDRRPDWLTLPNTLTLGRLVGALPLAALALGGHDRAFIAAYVVLAMTDWLDGKLAILLDQRSSLGARLDTWADAALYAALFLGLIVLQGPLLARESAWIAAALLSYLLSVGISLARYRRWPSYHTRMAKISWLLTFCAVIALFVWRLTGPLELALAAVTLTNLEGLIITAISPRWQSDVGSLYRVVRERKEHRETRKGEASR